MCRQEKRTEFLRICNRNKISQGEPPIKGDNIFLFCESTGWIVDWTHPAVDFAGQNKIRLLIRRSYRFRNIDSMLLLYISHVLQPKDSPSELAFLCDITVKM